MFSGAQISLYPMSDDFVAVILEAIGALDPYRPRFRIETDDLSTLIVGPPEELFPAMRDLFVSAARAPQFRLNYEPPPEPSDDELVGQLRRLEGVPANVLDNPEMLRMALPMLRADTRLYRNYVFTPEEALPVPVFAYGGESDPNVRPEHLDAWRLQTTAEFKRREFAGGHFYLQSAREELLRALVEDMPG